jgi:hypothetical protein
VRRIALVALSLVAFAAIPHLGCGSQSSNLFPGTGGTTSSSSGKSTTGVATSAGGGGSTTSAGGGSTTSAGGGGSTMSAGGGGSTTSAGGGGSTTSAGGGGSTTTTTTSGAVCTNPDTDCPNPGTKCVIVACTVAHTCTTVDAMTGTACSDGGGKVCDGSGHCVECNGGGDCAAQDTCQGGICVPPTMQQNGAMCTAGNQCLSTFCADGVCCAEACNDTCDQCNLPGLVGQCGSVGAGSDNPDHPCPGGVCTGAPTNACVQCVFNGNCGVGTVCDTMGDAQESTCVACNVNSDCHSGACDAHICAAGNWLSPNDAGPMVLAPACGGSLIAVANAACAAAYAGSHWCTVNDANGTGTYHTAACAANDFQFNGGVTCAGNEWSTDIGLTCVGGVVMPAVQPYFAVGTEHEVDCCN